jgi:putative phosphoribosyl transferase
MQLAQRFRDRFAAGQVLAEKLTEYADRHDVLVLGLPRGGVPVAFKVARALRASLDVFIVRKLGVPWHPELAMGAIASGGALVVNEDVVQMLDIDSREVERVAREEQQELTRREQVYRGERPPIQVAGRTVMVIDDGLATGSTMRAAVRALRLKRPTELVVGAPVGAADVCADLGGEADRVVCAITPEPFHAVGFWYEDFTQTTDDEVRELLALAYSSSRA